MRPSTQTFIDPATELPIGPGVNPSAARPPTRRILRGRFATLVPLDPARHLDALYEGTHGDDKERLWLYLGEGPFADRSSFRAFLEKRAESEDPLSFAVLLNATGKAVGHAAYMRITPQHRVLEVGNLFYTRELARTPGGTEAMYLMARHAFEDLGYRRYEWKCNALNLRSRQAALRLGFSFEGIFRQHMVQKGRSRDTAWFAMLDHEWPARKAAFEKWLSSDNFELQGRQRMRLSDIRCDASNGS